MARDRGELDLNAKVKIRIDDYVVQLVEKAPEGWSEGERLLLETTLGRYMFSEALPIDYGYVNTTVDRREISVIVNDLADRYPKVTVAASLDALKEAGFYWATRSGVSIAISYVIAP